MLVRARFDAAQTTPDNRRHWANADALAADAAASPEVRRTLRNRARYEVANNSYARGIVLTLANDVIGTGPRLQMLLGDGEDSGSTRYASDSVSPGSSFSKYVGSNWARKATNSDGARSKTLIFPAWQYWPTSKSQRTPSSSS
jgi:hypothetical protein